MPYKSLSAPRRVESLESEVRASAVLERPALVALLSSNPARLAVLPADSGTPKIVKLSIEQGDEVALLSRDIAVVRSENDVWAVLDVHRSGKLEQIATDVRALAAKPTGEHALILTWDGNASLLTAKKDEVDVRPFVLRGAVRAADLGPQDTTVVTEVPGGGLELRVHQGPTPEPGASQRAPLPAEAKRFDKLKSGRALNVFYARGATSACIVTQRGGRLTAKMVDVGVGIESADVAETSLVVGLVDGRCALFDGATLEAAGGRAMTPTHATPAGGGTPKTVSISNKAGSPSVWVGTSSGEIYRFSLPRKG